MTGDSPTTISPVDLLAFGPHPDDLEIGMGGTLAKQAARGARVGLCDLTRGEMGSNGTPEERLAEAEAAREVLGAGWRENLQWPDRAIGASPDHARSAASLIRRVRPRVVAVPYWDDRHPDHVAASRVLTEAIFNARLRRYEADGDAWAVAWTCYYFINDGAPPSFVVDVSEHYARKLEALACFRTQFQAVDPASVRTRLTSPLFMQLIESRDAHLGALAGVRQAEGFVVKEPVVRVDLFKDWGGGTGGSGAP